MSNTLTFTIDELPLATLEMLQTMRKTQMEMSEHLSSLHREFSLLRDENRQLLRRLSDRLPERASFEPLTPETSSDEEYPDVISESEVYWSESPRDSLVTPETSSDEGYPTIFELKNGETTSYPIRRFELNEVPSPSDVISELKDDKPTSSSEASETASGEDIIPRGIFKEKTFEEAIEDENCCAFLQKAHISPSIRRFKTYCINNKKWNFHTLRGFVNAITDTFPVEKYVDLSMWDTPRFNGRTPTESGIYNFLASRVKRGYPFVGQEIGQYLERMVNIHPGAHTEVTFGGEPSGEFSFYSPHGDKSIVVLECSNNFREYEARNVAVKALYMLGVSYFKHPYARICQVHSGQHIDIDADGLDIEELRGDFDKYF